MGDEQRFGDFVAVRRHGDEGAGTVAEVVLDRPKAMNAFDAGTARAIVEAVDAFTADPAVRVMVVGAAGEGFSAGGDFNWVLTWPNLDAITRRSRLTDTGAGAPRPIGSQTAPCTRAIGLSNCRSSFPKSTRSRDLTASISTS